MRIRSTRSFVILGLFAACSVAAFIACGGDDNAANPGPTGDDASPGTDSNAPPSGDDAGPGTDSNAPPGDDGGQGDDGPATNDSGIILGPTAISFPAGGSPDVILWDDAKKVLYVADDNNNQIWTWTDAAGFVKFATVPDEPAADEAGTAYHKLNGITELADGTLVVVRFSKGAFGAIYTVSPDGGTTTVPNVSPTEKRLGITVDTATGIIYNSEFTGTGGATTGGLETIDLEAGAATYAAGFTKPVGVVVQGSNVIVADEGNGTTNPGGLYAVPTDPAMIGDGGYGLIDGGTFPLYSAVFSPDMLAPGPNGSILTDQFTAAPDGGTVQIRQIFADGGYDVYTDAGFNALYDVQYDPTNARIFVVDHGTSANLIWIFPAH